MPPRDDILLVTTTRKFCAPQFLGQMARCPVQVVSVDFAEGCVISCVDFSKNYTLRVHNEIQNMHSHNFQVTSLVHICYRKLTQRNTLENGFGVVKEVHYYVLDDTMHDTLFVQHAFMLHQHHLKWEGCYPKVHYVWNDGCSGQFKSMRAQQFVFYTLH